MPSNQISEEEKQAVQKELEDWEAEILSIEKDKSSMEAWKKSEEEKQKGNDFMKAKEYQDAVEAYTKALSFDSKNSAVYSNRALAYLNQKRYQLVIEDCNKALELDPNYTKARNRRGKAYLATQEYRKALEDFEYVIEQFPDNAEVNADLKKCRDEVRKTGGFKKISIVEEEDEEEFQKIQIEEESDQEESSQEEDQFDSSEVVSDVLKSAETIKAQAIELYQNGKYHEAINSYSEALKQLVNLTSKDTDLLNNTKAALYSNIALCYYQLSEDHKVIEFSSSALNVKPSNTNILIKAHLRRALSSENLERVQAAKADMIKVKELDPSNMQASQALQRYAQHLNHEGEKQAVSKAANTQSIVARAEQMKNVGNSLFKKSDFDKAILEFTAAIKILTEELHNLLENPSAVALLINLYNNRALANSKLDCNTLVVQDCQEALKFDPDNLKSHYRLGIAHKNCGDLEKAVESLKKVTELDPKNYAAKQEYQQVVELLSEQISKQTQHLAAPKHHGRRVSFSSQQETVAETPTEPPKKPQKAVPLDSEKIAKAKQSASKLEVKKPPRSSLEFEQAIKTYKELYEYLVSQDPEALLQLYKSTQLPAEVLNSCVECLLSKEELNAEWALKFLSGVPSTQRFSTLAMMLSKSEKQRIQQLLDKVTEDSALHTSLLKAFRILKG